MVPSEFHIHVDADQIPGFHSQEMIAASGKWHPLFIRVKKKVVNGTVKWVLYRTKNSTIDMYVHL